MTTRHRDLSIDEYLRERLMPVEGAIPHKPGIEMYGNSVPVGTVGGDLFEYINFQQRNDIEAPVQCIAQARCQRGRSSAKIGEQNRIDDKTVFIIKRN